MALALFDRVQETSTTAGTGSIVLAGAVSGFQSFAVVGNGNTCYYTIVDGSAWEVGVGTYSTSGPTLARTTILSNSNGNTSPLTLTANSKSVFLTYPASKSVNLNESGNVSPLGTVVSGIWNGTTIGVAYGGTGVTASSGANSVVLRDSNQNITVNRINQGIQTITASGGTTVLTAASQFNQALVGTGGQTFRLPDATTLTDTTTFQFNNNATGTLTIQNNAGTTVGTIASGGAAGIALLSNATVGGTWDVHAYIPENVTWGTNALALGSTVISGGTWQGGTIQTAYGGTGLTSYTSGGAVYANSSSTLTSGTLPITAGGTGNTSGQAASTASSATFNSGGAGDASGTTFNGSAARTISYNTIGAPSTTGTNASGTWGINISGNAATATTATSATTATTATNQSGGTVNATTGAFSQNITVGTGTAVDPSNVSGFAAGQITEGTTGFSAPGIIVGSGAGQHGAIVYGSNTMYFGTENGSDNTMTTRATLSSAGAFNTTGAISQNGSQVLTAANYNSYAPTLTGGGASGTWGINITGSAGSAGSSTSVSATTSTGIQTNYLASINTTTPGLTNYGIAFSGSSISDFAQGITWGWSGTNAQAGIYVQSSGSYGTKMYFGTTDSFATGSKTSMSIDHVGNVNLPRGTFSNGSVWINNGANFNAYNENIRLFNAPNGVSVIGFSASGISGEPTTSILGFSDRWEVRFGGGWQQQTYNGYVVASGSFRAPIFYDSNNTTYYGDFENISSMYGVAIRGDTNSTDSRNQIFFWGAGDTTTSAIGFKASGGEFPNPTGFGDGYNTYLTMDSDGRGWVFRRGVGGSDFSAAYTAGWILNNGVWQANASMRAPIFYDSDDTAYYVNPNSETRIYLTSVNVGNEAPGGGNGSTQGLIMRGNYNSNSWAHKFHKYDNGSGVPLYVSQTIGNGSWGALQGWGTGLSYTSQVFGSFASDSLYSTIFYDNNNTAYYLDPASTSNINALQTAGQVVIGGTFANNAYNSVASTRLMFGGGNEPNNYSIGTNLENYGGNYTKLDIRWHTGIRMGARPGYGGIRFYEDETIGTQIFAIGKDGSFAQANQSMRAPIFYDLDNTGFYVDPAPGANGVSANFQGRIQLGTFNNSQTNSGEAWLGRASDRNSGTFTVQLGGGSSSGRSFEVVDYNWTTVMFSVNSANFAQAAGSLRAPIFYDSQDTAYYVDPNSTSLLYRGRYGPFAGSQSGNTSALEIMNTGGTGDASLANITFHCQSYYGTSLHLRADGYFGVGGWSATTWRWYTYLVNGDMTAAGNVTAYSDPRLKTDITPIQSALSIIQQLNGVRFKWIESSVIGHPGEYDYGVLADEVQKVLPELVSDSMHEAPEGDKYKTVAYDKFAPILIESVKELAKYVTALEQRISQLEARL